MEQTSDTSLLESLARDTHAPMDEVMALYQRERDALSRDATITSFISLLALRRVRHQLQASSNSH